MEKGLNKGGFMVCKYALKVTINPPVGGSAALTDPTFLSACLDNLLCPSGISKLKQKPEKDRSKVLQAQRTSRVKTMRPNTRRRRTWNQRKKMPSLHHRNQKLLRENIHPHPLASVTRTIFIYRTLYQTLFRLLFLLDPRGSLLRVSFPARLMYIH